MGESCYMAEKGAFFLAFGMFFFSSLIFDALVAMNSLKPPMVSDGFSCLRRRYG